MGQGNRTGQGSKEVGKGHSSQREKLRPKPRWVGHLQFAVARVEMRGRKRKRSKRLFSKGSEGCPGSLNPHTVL